MNNCGCSNNGSNNGYNNGCGCNNSFGDNSCAWIIIIVIIIALLFWNY